MVFGLLFSTYNLMVALGVNLPVAWQTASVTQAIIGILGSLFLYVLASLLTKGDVEKSTRFIKKADILNKYN